MARSFLAFLGEARSVGADEMRDIPGYDQPEALPSSGRSTRKKLIVPPSRIRAAFMDALEAVDGDKTELLHIFDEEEIPRARRLLSDQEVDPANRENYFGGSNV